MPTRAGFAGVSGALLSIPSGLPDIPDALPAPPDNFPRLPVGFPDVSDDFLRLPDDFAELTDDLPTVADDFAELPDDLLPAPTQCKKPDQSVGLYKSNQSGVYSCAPAAALTSSTISAEMPVVLKPPSCIRFCMVT